MITKILSEDEMFSSRLILDLAQFKDKESETKIT